MPVKSLLLLCLLGGCALSQPAPPPDSGRYTFSDSGRTVHHRVGDVLELRLPPSDSAGVSWGPPKLSGALLFYLGPSLEEAGGDTALRFRVDAPGVATLRVSERSMALGPLIEEGERGEVTALRQARLTVVAAAP